MPRNGATVSAGKMGKIPVVKPGLVVSKPGRLMREGAAGAEVEDSEAG
jgi:hypothetical protein